MWAISDALPLEAARAPSPCLNHHGPRRGVVGTLPNFSWTWTHHRSYMLLNGFKKYCFVLELRPKMFKNRVQIESKFRGFLPLQKLGEGWAKFLWCDIEFDLGPNMWYSFYDALLGSLGD